MCALWHQPIEAPVMALAILAFLGSVAYRLVTRRGR